MLQGGSSNYYYYYYDKRRTPNKFNHYNFQPADILFSYTQTYKYIHTHALTHTHIQALENFYQKNVNKTNLLFALVRLRKLTKHYFF